MTLIYRTRCSKVTNWFPIAVIRIWLFLTSPNTGRGEHSSVNYRTLLWQKVGNGLTPSPRFLPALIFFGDGDPPRISISSLIRQSAYDLHPNHHEKLTAIALTFFIIGRVSAYSSFSVTHCFVAHLSGSCISSCPGRLLPSFVFTTQQVFLRGSASLSQ